MPRIMIIDDDPHINELLQIYFLNDNFEVIPYSDGESALADFKTKQPECIILDLMLPGRSGYDVLKEIRKTSDAPVLMLTARCDTFDKIVGLELGADDYVEKPFEPKEIVARVKALIRRCKGDLKINPVIKHKSSEVELAVFEGLSVDKTSYTVYLDNQIIEMPPKELELLYYLVQHPDHVFTREQLLENIWGFNFYGESRTVDVHIKRIREKLDRYNHKHWQIKTVWGVGYKFETEIGK